MSRQIASRFRDIRALILRVSQDDLAAALGCSRSHISRVENGRDEYTFSQLQGISALCGVPVASFFEGYVYTSPDAMLAEWLPGYMRLAPDMRARFDGVIDGMLGVLDEAARRPPMDVFRD